MYLTKEMILHKECMNSSKIYYITIKENCFNSVLCYARSNFYQVMSIKFLCLTSEILFPYANIYAQNKSLKLHFWNLIIVLFTNFDVIKYTMIFRKIICFHYFCFKHMLHKTSSLDFFRCVTVYQSTIAENCRRSL